MIIFSFTWNLKFLFLSSMAIRKVIRVGDPRLRQPSEEVPVTEIRSKEVKKLIRDMFDTMFDAKGVGLAGPQIGVMKRIVVIGFEGEGEENVENIERMVLINPVIESLTENLEGNWEGCLSLPEMRGYVERPRKIRLKWYDENEDFHDDIIEGYEAIVYQHETDHLNGILYIDRLKDPQLFGYNAELDAAEEEKKIAGRAAG